jgi:hypothetical protein
VSRTKITAIVSANPMYNRKQFSRSSGGVARAKRRCDWGIKMRHSCVARILSSACLMATIGLTALSASAQTQKKESVWDKIKKAGQQGMQQGQPQQQPGQQPGQKTPKPGQQSSGGGLINDSGPFKPPAGTKIEETVLAPVQEGAKFSGSPHGVHVATVGTDGSRAVAYYDGVQGPKFDEILPQDNSFVAFSPDGTRYAYCARAGNQYVVMVDGKELARSSESQGGIFNTESCRLGFTSNNKHVYYFSAVTVSNPSTLTYRRFVFDGKPEPPNTSEWHSVAFSPDGDHYAYVWNDPRKQKPWMLIVDGKPAPYQGGAPQWTNDSKHLYTQRSAPATGTELLFDGKPIAKAFNFTVYIPPVGDLVVVAVTGGTNFHPFSFLVVNGKKVPGSDTVERGAIDTVVFSPDGKHYAAICGDTSSHHYVIVDGKRGPEYVSVDKLAFTADSSTVVYQSFVNGRQFIVVGDQEFGAPMGGLQPPVIAQVGNRVAAFIRKDGNVPSLLIDKKLTPLNARGGSDLSFTPDGAHYAYVANDEGLGLHLVIDGMLQPQSAISGERINMQEPGAVKYIFSADSKHAAHFANSETAHGIFLDGKFIPASQEGTNTDLTFSPDSKHLFWIHQYGDRPLRVFIDGKPLVDFYAAGNSLSSVPHWWDFGLDGTLSLLAQDDNSLKRITITLSPETSLATMLGGGTPVASTGN